MEKLYFGFSRRDITPVTDKMISLAGQYYARHTREIHSRLEFNCVAISKGSEQLIMGTLDGGGMQEPVHEKIREEVAKREPAIRKESIFINAIHTHNAPSMKVQISKDAIGPAMQEDEEVYSAKEYTPFVIPLISETIVEAWRKREEGGIMRAFGNARIGHCRRAVYSDGTAEMYGDTTRRDFVGLEAGEDTGVDILYFCDKTGRKKGMFLNVACPSQVMEATYKVSSDFAGRARELLKEEYGEDFHTLYQISPAGCQSPRDLVRHYTVEPDFWHEDGVEEHAKRLLHAVRTAQEYPIDYSPIFKQTTLRVGLPRRRASYMDYINAQKEVARLTAILPEKEAFAEFCKETFANEKLDGPGPYDSKLHHFVKIKNANAVINRYQDQDAKPSIHFDMNVARIGDIAIATNPFELYLYFGQIIKARSKAVQTFLVQLSAGADLPGGYLPSPDAEKFGGYGGLIINGQVGSDGGYKLVDTTVEAINQLFEE